MAEVKQTVNNLRIRHEEGTDRTYIATWTDNIKNVDHYEVTWQYRTGNGIWVAKGTDSVEKIHDARKQSSYTAPNNATEIRVAVKPVSKTKKSSSGNDGVYFNGAYCEFVTEHTDGILTYAPASGFIIEAVELKLLTNTASTIYASLPAEELVYEETEEVFKDLKKYVMDGYTVPNDFISGYQYDWEYSVSTSGDLWIRDESNTGEGTVVTYSYKTEAKRVRFRYRPVSNTFVGKDGAEHPIFSAGYSQWSIVTISALVPSVPKVDPPRYDKFKMELMKGTSDTIIVSWTYNEKNVQSYSYQWDYKVNNLWITGDLNGSTTKNNFTFTLPSASAKEVRIRVKPISKTYTAYQTSYNYFTSKYSAWINEKISSFKTPIPEYGTTDAATLKLQHGTADTLFAAWSWDESHTAEYETEWDYATGDKYDGKVIYFEGARDTASTNNATYTFPSNATIVRFRYRPIAETHLVNGEDTLYWKASFSGWQKIKMASLVPTPPTVKEVTKATIGPGNTRDKLLVTVAWDQPRSDFPSEIGTTWFVVRKLYRTADGGTRYADGSESLAYENIRYVNVNDGTDLYIFEISYNQNAWSEEIAITPIAGTHTVDGTDVAWWTTKESDWFVFKMENLAPEVPPTPTVTISDLELTARVDNYNSAKFVKFRIIKDDSSNIFNEGFAEIHTRAAIFKCPIEAGGAYKVCALGSREANDKCAQSEWSSYCSNVNSGPGLLTGLKVQALSSNSAKLTWNTAPNAETYEIEYTQDPANFGTGSGTQTESTTENVGIKIFTGLDPGKWWFRARSVNQNGHSAWKPTDIAKNPVTTIMGSTPAPPTTWSEATIISIGDTARLFWVHNADDGSNETSAQIYYYFDGNESSAQTITITDEATDEDVSDQIHNYEYNTSSLSQGGSFFWKVRTAGATGEYSEWSVLRQISIYAPASIAFTIPAKITSLPIAFEAQAGPQEQSAISYSVNIVANSSYHTTDATGRDVFVVNGEQVFSRFYDTNSNLLNVSIGAGDVTLENNISYTLTVTVAMNSGLIVTRSRNFTVGFSYQDYAPDASVILDYDRFCSYIQPYVESSEGTLVSGVTLSVYRREYDGRFTQIATGIANTRNVSVVDPHPALDYARYRITAL